MGAIKKIYDIIIIGSGAGGGVAAHMAAAKGKSVAIVEQELLGGECPNYGCVPTKALLHSADILNTIKEASHYGINVGSVSVDHDKIQALKDEAVKNTGTSEGTAVYKADGVDVLIGHAHFLNQHTLNVGGERYQARNFLIAAGARDLIPPIDGLEEAGYIGYRDALSIKPPKTLCVIGGGAIGVEFSHYFSSFGTKVTLLEVAPRLLMREDEEIGDLTEAIFVQNGIDVRTDTIASKVEKIGRKKKVTFMQHGKRHTVTVDKIMVAAGKRPNLDLGLDNAGVTYDHHGVHVNRYMQTSTPHIYAAGDVTGKYMFTHVASYQSRLAAHNMLSTLKHLADYRAVPRCVYISPEVAAVGATEAELEAKGTKYQAALVPTSIIGRANTTGDDTGFVKILADKKGRLLGASIIAPRAGEMMQELALAIQWRMKASKIDYTMHAFPTWSEAVRICAAKIDCR